MKEKIKKLRQKNIFITFNKFKYNFCSSFII